MKMNIDTAIRSFAQFINNSWEKVFPLLEDRDYTTDESSVCDWLQANWELLVERKVLKVNQYLDVYAEGADFNGSSSRITDPNAIPDFSIKVKGSLGNEILDVLNNQRILIGSSDFLELVSFKEGFYQKEPPFEYALLEDDVGVERVVLLKDLEFELEKIEKEASV